MDSPEETSSNPQRPEASNSHLSSAEGTDAAIDAAASGHPADGERGALDTGPQHYGPGKQLRLLANDSYINWDLSVVDEHHHDDSVGDDAYLHSDGPDQSQPFVTPRPGPASSAAANDDALFHTPFSPHHQQPPSRLDTDTAIRTEDSLPLPLPGAGTEPPPLPRFGSPSQATDEDVRDRSWVVAEEGADCQGGEGAGKGDSDGGGGGDGGDGGNGGDRGRDEDHRLLTEALGRARAAAGGSGLKERKRDYGKPWLANTLRAEEGVAVADGAEPADPSVSSGARPSQLSTILDAAGEKEGEELLFIYTKAKELYGGMPIREALRLYLEKDAGGEEGHQDGDAPTPAPAPIHPHPHTQNSNPGAACPSLPPSGPPASHTPPPADGNMQGFESPITFVLRRPNKSPIPHNVEPDSDSSVSPEVPPFPHALGKRPPGKKKKAAAAAAGTSRLLSPPAAGDGGTGSCNNSPIAKRPDTHLQSPSPGLEEPTKPAPAAPKKPEGVVGTHPFSSVPSLSPSPGRQRGGAGAGGGGAGLAGGNTAARAKKRHGGGGGGGLTMTPRSKRHPDLPPRHPGSRPGPPSKAVPPLPPAKPNTTEQSSHSHHRTEEERTPAQDQNTIRRQQQQQVPLRLEGGMSGGVVHKAVVKQSGTDGGADVPEGPSIQGWATGAGAGAGVGAAGVGMRRMTAGGERGMVGGNINIPTKGLQVYGSPPSFYPGYFSPPMPGFFPPQSGPLPRHPSAPRPLVAVPSYRPILSYGFHQTSRGVSVPNMQLQGQGHRQHPPLNPLNPPGFMIYQPRPPLPPQQPIRAATGTQLRHTPILPTGQLYTPSPARPQFAPRPPQHPTPPPAPGARLHQGGGFMSPPSLGLMHVAAAGTPPLMSPLPSAIGMHSPATLVGGGGGGGQMVGGAHPLHTQQRGGWARGGVQR
ncbi:unnamed protein product [Vitrella brassicaformis CCMP3155]|uniref:Uncharacterized protein n=2 Tax=Vitrella brassicaformis TaxID=1169539 RepID=A0A0G4EA70_VITBC|nr:unnamed protein product [Vitrella brassicaformis CCMP3155]|eukprot:CEL92136.1 unnamed protein product [Vitrella brassicaformis CCMP3155]